MTTIMNRKQYLGDGVYVSFDGYQLWLMTENGYETTNSIALEPAVYSALLAYVERLKAEQDAQAQPATGQ